MVSRRGALRRLAAVSGAAGLSGCAGFLARRAEVPTAGLPPNPRAGELPHRQHAWDAALARDAHGNPIAPRHHRVLLLDLAVEPSESAARTVERAMRTLEAVHDWGPDGLFHGLAWGTRYFERIGRLSASPVRSPTVLSRTDDPDLLSFDAALLLASDAASTLGAVEAAMFGGRSELAGEPVEDRLGEVFDVAGRRTGFMGEGLPAAHADAEGIPDDAPLGDAPMFTGFFSGRRKTQATEDRVTIREGPYAGGTTAHLSHLVESLDDWWSMDEAGRTARMFSPEFSEEDVESFTDDVPFSDAVREHARESGVVGHFEKVARVREDGRPILLRRDFNTTDGGRAGVHFLSFQRSLDDFEKARKSMNGWYLRDDHPAVRDRKNNGIREFISVVSRANFYLPPRDERAFPG
ncbi:hypothetical protein ACFQE8_07495 [Salinirubellus sp. GCM10025818]|uniref:DUF7405 family protein n=1 Tax=Salinirubellus TaxID=2162630 RepID=UPI0030CD516B